MPDGRNGIWFGYTSAGRARPPNPTALAAGIPRARPQIIEHAGHNPHAEQPAEVMQAVRDFISE